jgi:hypothetical protein
MSRDVEESRLEGLGKNYSKCLVRIAGVTTEIQTRIRNRSADHWNAVFGDRNEEI